jgi:hypothetical protein
MMNARLSEEQDLVARVLTSLGVDEVVQREDDES